MALSVFILVATLLSSTLGVYAILMNERRKSGKRVKTNNLAKVTKSYKFLSENFLTRRSFRKVVEQVAGLSIYNFWEVRVQAVKYFTQTTAISVGMVIIGAFLFRDILSTLMVCVFAVVVHTTLITKRLDEVHFKVLKEFSVALSSVREHYTRLGNIPDAISECSKGPYVQKTLDKIHIILTANDAEEKLEEFYRTVPFHMLQTFAGVCYILNDAGDEKAADGTSAFKTSITLLKNEADLEIRKLTKQKLLFSSLEYLPLAPLPAIALFEMFFMSSLPGTASIYNGMVGYLSETLTILSGLVGYYMITTINNASSVKHDDRSEIIMRIMDFRPLRSFFKNITPKKAKTRNKFTLLLKGALSQKNLEYIYASKVIVSTLAFVITVFLLTAFTYIGKEYTYNNIFAATLDTASNLTVEDAARLREIDAQVLSRPEMMRKTDLLNLLSASFPDMTQMDLQDQVDRIIAKYSSYHNAKFHWWFILVGYAMAGMMWYIPELMVRMRRKMVAAEAEEDVLQMQTMISILMYTNLDTLEVLWWLARQSRIHKDALSYAYHEYPSDPELALSRLKDKSTLPEFQQLIERLFSTVHQISLADAFSDLITERDHMLRIKEMVQEASLMKKRASASPFSRASLIIACCGHVLAPIAILAVSGFINVFNQL